MNNKIISIAVIIMLVPLTLAWAVDLNGNWIAQIPSSQGIIETVFSFRVDGTKLTGKVNPPEGATPISEGKIDGDKISFVVKQQIGEKQIIQRYKGELAGMVYGDEIKLTREVQGGIEPPQEFIAKREFPLGDYDLPMKVPIPPLDPQNR